MLQEKRGEIAPEGIKRLSQRGNKCPVEDLPGGESKERYCIGTWNVRSMNQGKLEMVKQEMVRVNTNILGIS